MVLPALQEITADRNVHLENELLVGLDVLELLTSGILWGCNGPRGRDDPVQVIHGFLTTDATTDTLRNFLRRMGYRVYRSEIGQNADCINEAVRTTIRVATQAKAETGKKVKLIGHSLGGIIARIAVNLRPDLFDMVITMGTPINGAKVTASLVKVHGFVQELLQTAGRPKNCFTPGCSCEAVRSFSLPIPEEIYHDSIYTKTDGVVSWECCLEEDPACNHLVSSSHSGLVLNKNVFVLLSQLLARKRVVERLVA